LLFQDDRGGLQVKNPDGEFIAAPPIKDTIVVNAGDLLQRWSNDIIKSTEHRVVSRTCFLTQLNLMMEIITPRDILLRFLAIQTQMLLSSAFQFAAKIRQPNIHRSMELNILCRG
jgi:hypothetical protein